MIREDKRDIEKSITRGSSEEHTKNGSVLTKVVETTVRGDQVSGMYQGIRY